jgi:internalin A
MGLEAMGEQDYPIGKLRIRVNIRQILDGYESQAARQQRQLKERGMDIDFRDDMPGIHVNISQQNSPTHQHGKGDNVAGDLVQGDKLQP